MESSTAPRSIILRTEHKQRFQNDPSNPMGFNHSKSLPLAASSQIVGLSNKDLTSIINSSPLACQSQSPFVSSVTTPVISTSTDQIPIQLTNAQTLITANLLELMKVLAICYHNF